MNFVPPRGKSRSILSPLAEAWNIEVFAPTFVQLVADGSQVKKREKPLLYHYVFLRGSGEEIKRFALANQGFSFVIDRAGNSRHVTVSDETLEQFRIIASYHAGKLPCYPLEGVDLEQGDKVQVVSGQFAGLTGTYMSRKGGKKGNILVAIDSGLAAVVYDVKAEYVRVLEFARDSRRIYDQLDAFADKLLNPEYDDFTKRSAAASFTTRLGMVKVGNPKLNAKLQALLYAGYRLLSDESMANEALQRYRELEEYVTNPKTQELCKLCIERFAYRG